MPPRYLYGDYQHCAARERCRSPLTAPPLAVTVVKENLSSLSGIRCRLAPRGKKGGEAGSSGPLHRDLRGSCSAAKSTMRFFSHGCKPFNARICGPVGCAPARPKLRKRRRPRPAARRGTLKFSPVAAAPHARCRVPPLSDRGSRGTATQATQGKHRTVWGWHKWLPASLLRLMGAMTSPSRKARRRWLSHMRHRRVFSREMPKKGTPWQKTTGVRWIPNSARFAPPRPQGGLAERQENRQVNGAATLRPSRDFPDRSFDQQYKPRGKTTGLGSALAAGDAWCGSGFLPARAPFCAGRSAHSLTSSMPSLKPRFLL